VGYLDGEGDGIMCPGGSICNLQALSFARHSKFPDSKKTGLFGLPRMMIYTSAEAHYSLEKAAFTCGMGTDSVVKVPTDVLTGEMIPAELERLVAAGDDVKHLVSANPL
jgi:glutamate/tyrosine decarboxylase-like PLP-dependent enzyme